MQIVYSLHHSSLHCLWNKIKSYNISTYSKSPQFTFQTPIKGAIQNYDPHNYDDFYADEYGGFGAGQGGSGGGGGGGPPRGGPRGGPPRGGPPPRMPMGPGGPGGDDMMYGGKQYSFPSLNRNAYASTDTYRKTLKEYCWIGKAIKTWTLLPESIVQNRFELSKTLFELQ